MVSIQDKIYNIDLVVEDIKLEPQTYNTILKEEVLNPTFQFSLRRKINNLCKQGIVFKTSIPGTRFGQALIYFEPRQYKIIVESSRTGVNVYYFFQFKKVSQYYIRIPKYWRLENTKWVEVNEELDLFEGKILKFI